MASARRRASPREVQTTNRVPEDRRWLALTAVMISMFFSSLDQTVVSTAMPTIVSDLSGFTLYAWVFTAYILSTAVTVPLYGRLSDIYGRKPMYAFGLVVFLIGSALSGQATSMGMLIGARVLQGIGGGAMMSMPRATIGDIFNPRERGRWMGLIMGVFGLATIIGPTVGGWITDNISWRWVFYINMPVALAALGMVLYALPTVRTGARHHIDWTGSLTLAAFLVPMLLGISFGGTTYAWTSWQEIALFAGSVVMLVLFIFNERRAEEPIIALSIFQNRTFTSVMVITLMVAMAMFGTMMFLPVYVQGVLDMSAQASGYVLTPMMLSFIVASIIGGQIITRSGRYKAMIITGGALMVFGALLFTRLSAGSTWQTVVRDMVVMGLGIGTLMPAMSTIIQNLFPYKILGLVNATQQAANTLAGAIASPILGAALATGFAGKLPGLLPSRLVQAFSKLSPAQRKALTDPQGVISAQGQTAIQHQFAAFGAAGQTLYTEFIRAVHVALAGAMRELFWISVAFAVLGFFFTLIVREVPLKQNEFFDEPEDRPEEGRGGRRNPRRREAFEGSSGS